MERAEVFRHGSAHPQRTCPDFQPVCVGPAVAGDWHRGVFPGAARCGFGCVPG